MVNMDFQGIGIRNGSDCRTSRWNIGVPVSWSCPFSELCVSVLRVLLDGSIGASCVASNRSEPPPPPRNSDDANVAMEELGENAEATTTDTESMSVLGTFACFLCHFSICGCGLSTELPLRR